MHSVVDPDRELSGKGRGGEGKGCVLLPLPAFLPSVVSSFLSNIRGVRAPGPSPTFITLQIEEEAVDERLLKP